MDSKGRLVARIVFAASLFSGFVPGGARAASPTDETVPANRRNYDALAERASGRVALAAPQGRLDPALLKAGAPLRVQGTLGVPTFLWAAPAASAAPAAAAGRLAQSAPASGAESAAREILRRYAPAYGLDDAAASRAVLREVHSTGRGGIIVRFGEEADGVEVFRNEIKILLTPDLEAVALAGYLTGHVPTGGFVKTPAEAIAAAAADFTGSAVDPKLFKDTARRQGPYSFFETSARAALAAGARLPEPTRVKQVWFDLPEGLVPAYYVELDFSSAVREGHGFFSYVVSAADGSILFRNDLTADASFTYRVWAESSGAFRPFDGPQGTDPTPHVALDGFQAPFLLPPLVTLTSSPFTANDPWLPAGATETTGNNVEAYVDLFTPDGFSAGDFHASVTAPGVFDYTHDLTIAPNFVPPSGARTQQMAAIVQLFYDLNFFHDWYYDAGFNEISGNAQTSNYGRGGVEGDSIRAEAQDFSGRNNANMSTPADGGRPRMQMFLFDGLGDKKVTVTATPLPGSLPLGDYAPVGTAAWGPTAFTTSAEIVWATAGGNHDGCGNANLNGAAGIGVAATGKIVFIDRGGSCTGGFAQKYQNAVLAGAAGVIIANISTSASPGTAPGMAGTPTGATTIGILSLNFSMGQQFRAAFPAGTVQGTITRPVPGVDRDGALDPQIQAHEWGHYISNRLVGNANGLTTNLSRGLGEGWADFHAMLLTVRSEDVLVTGNDQWQAPYALGGYTTPAFSAPSNPYYYGIRRFPYSTDLTKNPLMYRHIANQQTISGAPINLVVDDGSGSNNAEVHNTGEVWATMLWECYAALLRDVTNNTSGRGLTFAQAQTRMKDYVVAGYKMTPTQPTLLEARDAVLAAAWASDVVDYQLFAAAFAKRGAGAAAQSPERNTLTNIGAVEDTTAPIGLALATTPSVGDDVTSVCTADGVLQIGETGTMTVVLKNLLPGVSPATTGTLTSSSTGVVIPSPTLSFSAAPGGGVTVASTSVGLDGTASGTKFDFSLSLTNALSATPVVVTFSIRANYLVGTSATDDVESPHSAWTTSLATPTWRRIESGPAAHRWLGPDSNAVSDITLTSPVLQVGGGTFSFSFQHRYQFEFSTTGPTFFDGGVVEISTDNGATWADVGAASISTLGVGGYLAALTSNSGSVVVNPLLASGGLNNLQGRPAFTGISPLYPTLLGTTVNLGTAFANQAVRVRFRAASDVNGGATGWEIDNIAFSGVVNQPFDALTAFTGSCPSTASPPTALAGPPQSVLQNALVTLNGSGSTTPNPGPLTYTWVQVGGPSVVLNTPTSQKPTFTAPAVAPTSTTTAASVTLIFMLTVNDGTATSAPSFVNVTVTNPNRIPVANAGAPQTVTAGALVTLAGSATDADAGTVFTWAWTQTGGPAVTLSSNTAQQPTFTAPAVSVTTVFTFQLVANDGQVNSAPSSTTVTVNPAACNVSAVAIVAPAAVCAGSTGNVASVPVISGPPYAWQILSGGTITSATNGPSITFTANATGPVVISVSVGSAACVFTNQVSVPVTALPSVTITAPGSVVAGSTGNTASVPDAGPGATYSWGISGGTIELTGVFGNTVTFTAGASGSVVLSVTVTQNGCPASGTSASIPITASGTGRLSLVTPCRSLDTRNANGPLGGPALAAGATRVFPVASSSCGIPANATAVAVNFTVITPAASGSLSADAGNQTPGIPSVISFNAGKTRANNGIVRLATDGSGTLAVTNNSAGSVHLLVDVVGYFP